MNFNQVCFWDAKGIEDSLSLEETKVRGIVKEENCKWVSSEEVS